MYQEPSITRKLEQQYVILAAPMDNTSIVWYRFIVNYAALLVLHAKGRHKTAQIQPAQLIIIFWIILASLLAQQDITQILRDYAKLVPLDATVAMPQDRTLAQDVLLLQITQYTTLKMLILAPLTAYQDIMETMQLIYA